MLLNNTAKQTSDWQLKGATYKKDNAFYYVGDNIDGQIKLSFNVNGNLKTIAIPEPLKNLNDIYDEIKNGVVHYSTKTFTVDSTTVLFIENSWSQTEQTVVCYCYMPYDVQANTPILCDKLDVISGMITKSNECGVKVVNKVLALRLSAQLLNVSRLDSNETILKKFSAYLKDNPFTVLYRLAQPVSSVLINYAFDIYSANNTITCSTQNEPSYFSVNYPIDVIINTTIDPKEMQTIAAYVKETKAIIDVIESELKIDRDLVGTQYQEVQNLSKQTAVHASSINKIYDSILICELDVNSALQNVVHLKEEVEAFKNEVALFASTVNTSIQAHNDSAESHSDIRLENTTSYENIQKVQAENHKTTQEQMQAISQKHELDYLSIQEGMQKIDEKINFDFGAF